MLVGPPGGGAGRRPKTLDAALARRARRAVGQGCRGGGGRRAGPAPPAGLRPGARAGAAGVNHAGRCRCIASGSRATSYVAACTPPLAHHSGVAAEEAAARLYRAEGGSVRAARWRCPEGEIDLVVELPSEIVFVEVKARRRHAADAVTPRQWARIGAAASRSSPKRPTARSPAASTSFCSIAAAGSSASRTPRSFDEW